MFGNKARFKLNQKKIENSYEMLKKHALLESKKKNSSKYLKSGLTEAEIEELINKKFNHKDQKVTFEDDANSSN